VNIGSGDYSAVADFDMLPERTPNATKAYAGLVSDGAGNVWGTFADTSLQWGALDRYEGGAIFKVSASDSIFTEVVQFTRPPTPKELVPVRPSSLVSDPGGSLWGATTITPEAIGLIYRVDPATWETTIVADAGRQKAGYFPTQPLMSDGKGSLWGMGNYGIWRADDFKSVVFKVNANTGEVVTVSELPSNVFLDLFPLPLVNDGAGRFWARGDSGDLLRIDEASGAVTVFQAPVEGSFSSGSLVTDGKGKLWSTSVDGTRASASILEIDPLTGARQPIIFSPQRRSGRADRVASNQVVRSPARGTHHRRSPGAPSSFFSRLSSASASCNRARAASTTCC
jgi:streptogramin lyase